jgi:KipI family sensor histidine kinase inhibitor
MLSEELWYPRLQLASDCSLLVTFGDAISRQHHLDVLRLFLLLRSEARPAIRNIHPAYSSLLISFDSLVVGTAAFETYVHDLIGRIDSVAISPSRTVEIPVCYDKEFGPDLEFVAAHNDIRVDEAIHYHTSIDFLVYFLGFSPGFPYLGDLPKQLVTPRLSTPRVKVPAGSVAIGGSQTGIYPVDSPGGWRIIGRTPTRLFQSGNASPTLLQMGDVVRFKLITRKQFEQMVEKEQMGGWG